MACRQKLPLHPPNQKGLGTPLGTDPVLEIGTILLVVQQLSGILAFSCRSPPSLLLLFSFELCVLLMEIKYIELN